jgi:diaminobutyrate-2-oxoglutarate transaminase
MHRVGEIVVQKFGGAALANVEAMKSAAMIVKRTWEMGRVPCVVVSAMGATTDDLIALARQCGDKPSKRELDALLACGESMSAALFALCLRTEGVAATSLSGAQAGFVTNGEHGSAAVTSVKPDRVSAILSEGHVPVVAGFQGLAPNFDVTTLGRGGSDLTAVVLGAALGARVVELFKDVDGIYEHDPNEHPDAVRHDRLDYDAMLAILANNGHAVLQSKAVEHAKRHRVTLRVVPFANGLSATAGTFIKAVTMPIGGRTSQLPKAMQVPPHKAPDLHRLPSIRPVAPPAPIAPAAPDARGGTHIFEARESNVRGYCRTFPTVFARAKGAIQWTEDGRRFIDFFSGAGALNYGHNPDAIKQRMIEYLASDGVSHALDMYTQAKRTFLETFTEVVLEPRALDYKVQFCGPTGANAVEAALKLARLATGRTTIASFTGGWHGMTAACLAVCGNRENREAAGAPLPFTTVLPYPDGPYQMKDALGYVESLFDDPNSGLDLPAAMILETIQGEGGIYVAPREWLQGIRALCDKHGVLLIVDDVQVGCGRGGTFFSFERAGIVPDIVCLSKSIGGYGQPMALLLMKPEVDVWKPGQHTGTFRGNQLAFVAATAALEHWRDPAFTAGIAERGRFVEKCLRERISGLAPDIEVRGQGLLWGLDVARAGGPAVAKAIGARCFELGLLIERCGRDDTVLKVMPPLNVDLEHLAEGCGILAHAAADVLAPSSAAKRAG